MTVAERKKEKKKERNKIPLLSVYDSCLNCGFVLRTLQHYSITAAFYFFILDY